MSYQCFVILTLWLNAMVTGDVLKLFKSNSGTYPNLDNEKLCGDIVVCPNKDLKYIIITSTDPESHYVIRDTDGDEVIRNAKFISGVPLKVVVPGLDGISLQNALVMYLIPAYAKVGDFNIITPIYTDDIFKTGFLCGPKPAAAIGDCMSRFLMRIYRLFPEFTLNNTHVIGASYGAMVSVSIGSHLDGQLRRVTLLDPPEVIRPFHYNEDAYATSSEVAQMVDAYHTNCGYIGTWTISGSVDVIFNNGAMQPGITTGTAAGNIRSHAIVIEYFMASIIQKRYLQGRRCDYRVYDFFIGLTDHACPEIDNDQKQYFLGENISPDTNGTFVVFTSGEYPFTLGDDPNK